MKKMLALVLCCIFVFVPVVPAVAAETETSEPVESILSFLEENITVTDHGNGVIEYTLAPVMANMTVTELAEAAGVTVAVESQPVYNAAAIPDYDYTTGQTHTPISLEQKYLYSLLDAQDKAYYRTIYNAVKNLEEESTFDISMSDTGKYALYHTVMFDNPELFYLCNTVAIWSNSDGTSNLVYSYAASRDEYCSYGHNPSRITPELKAKILTKKAVFDKAVNAFISTIPSNAPVVVKERLIYAKILLSSHYNLSAQWNGICEDNWNAYGIICNGYGVCESYSEAFQTLCHAVGIECTGVIGVAGGEHKWNAVKIEGDWYQCDITFDDPIGGDPDAAYSHYFNLTDEQMAEDNHDWSNCDFPVPVCNSSEYGRENFIERFGNDESGRMHYFDNLCDDDCNNCDYTRWVGEHEFVDGVCKHCNYGAMQGWRLEDGLWYYYRNNQRVFNEWVEDANGRRYVGADGALVTASFIYDENGQEVCYVDANGHVVKNAWHLQDGKWYYLGADSKKVTNKWMKDSKGWVKLGADGAMLTNKWTTDSKGWCFVGADGYAVTNCWKKDSTGWIWLNANGSMTKSKWIKDGGKWYYLNAKGYMSVNKWEKDSKGWVKLGADGAMLINKWTTDSKGWCFVGADGYAVTKCWKKDSTGWIYLDKEGSMTKAQWVKDGGKWYYCDAKGYMVAGKSMKIGNKTYKFNASGVCTNP